jgi:hypothetical protein
MPIIPISGSAASRGALVPMGTATVTNTTTTDVAFTNIPQIYQDLYVVFQGRRTDGAYASNVFIQGYGAGSIGTAFGTTVVESNGAVMSSYRYQNQSGTYSAVCPAAYALEGMVGSTIGYIFNYASTTTAKTSIYKYGADINSYGGGETRQGLRAGVLTNNNPVTTVSATTFTGSAFWTPGTTVSLYGIRRVNQ